MNTHKTIKKLSQKIATEQSDKPKEIKRTVAVGIAASVLTSVQVIKKAHEAMSQKVVYTKTPKVETARVFAHDSSAPGINHF